MHGIDVNRAPPPGAKAHLKAYLPSCGGIFRFLALEDLTRGVRPLRILRRTPRINCTQGSCFSTTLRDITRRQLARGGWRAFSAATVDALFS
jgi:hypothetical protein